jgi:glucose/arabinose dehydrogenase
LFLGLGTGLFYARPWSTDSTNVREVHADIDWWADWALQSGFTVEVDSQGFQLPTSIAFVPNPGDKPDDPLYFVTELFGAVRVVTNDRTVHTFAEGFFDATESPETGLGAVCLDPANGYVFVTFSRPDEEGILRNDIVRFQSQPGTFSIAPGSHISFAEIFASFRAGGDHQIGNCVVNGEPLYVSVGDGYQTTQSQQVDLVLGKVLRMTLDGGPVSDNSYFQEDDSFSPNNYVWAMGFRNPFGLEEEDGRVFFW